MKKWVWFAAVLMLAPLVIFAQDVRQLIVVRGAAADDAAVSGNPVLIGAETWTAGSSPSSTSAGGEVSRLLATPEGRLAIEIDHPRRFNCNITTTATSSTVITSCTAPGAGLSRYITDITIYGSASTVSTATILQYGTGASCGTGTTVVYRCGHPAASQCQAMQRTSIVTAANTDLCILSAETGTKTVSVQGYIAP